jgi:hypothetical protein
LKKDDEIEALPAKDAENLVEVNIPNKLLVFFLLLAFLKFQINLFLVIFSFSSMKKAFSSQGVIIMLIALIFIGVLIGLLPLFIYSSR